ncbi:MAG: hypothetical protein HKN43_01550 [Rhodothermales bacterium]|nr:hypothetical protein [Rhodothermales bacterium]
MIKDILLVCSVVIGLSGCNLFGDGNDTFQTSRELWLSQGLDHYRYEITIGCFCTIAGDTPARVTVLDDSVSAAIRLRDNVDISSQQLAFIPSIEKLFDIIREATGGEADEIEVTYDRQRGFPTSVSIDYIKDAVDDEISYSISAVQAIQE